MDDSENGISAESSWWSRLFSRKSKIPISKSSVEDSDPEHSSIIIDDRERASQLNVAVNEAWGREAKIERLPVGDVLVSERYLIERKTAADFAASIVDGRLLRQAAELCSQEFEPVLIIEGEFTPKAAGQMKSSVLRGMMLSLQFDWHVPILRSRSVQDTATWIVLLAQKVDRKQARPDWRRVSPMGRRIPKRMIPNRPKPRQLTPQAEHRRQVMDTLSTLPGVGRTNAEALFNRYQSLSAILQATQQDIAEIEGIGRKLAMKIYYTLHDEDQVERLGRIEKKISSE